MFFWNIHLCKRLTNHWRALRGFAGSEGLNEKILAVVDAASSRQQLKLHLQVAAFFAQIFPSVPIYGWFHLEGHLYIKGGGPFR